MSIRCFARRLMAPFQGTFQTVAVDDAEAESADGTHWTVYLTAQNIVSHTGLAEIRYGVWTAHNGITQAKVQGVADLSTYQHSLSALIKALEQYAPQAPFPAVDHFEFWLLDNQYGKPLALLDSATHIDAADPFRHVGEWRPSQSVANNFQSEYGCFDDLVALVNQTAGKPRRTAWYRRDSDANGLDLAGKLLPAGDFPDMQIHSGYFDEKNNRMIQDYIYWDAPALLQLPNLSRQQRQKLEGYAWAQPLRVAQLYSFYPQIIDTTQLNCALVKARLIGKSDKIDNWHEPFLPVAFE